jgi:predicted DNA-binding transcriptional regulator YafY
LGFGPNLEVLEPVSLREKVREMAKLVLEKYSESGQ